MAAAVVSVVNVTLPLPPVVLATKALIVTVPMLRIEFKPDASFTLNVPGCREPLIPLGSSANVIEDPGLQPLPAPMETPLSPVSLVVTVPDHAAPSS